jgi:hypothetical protein
MEWMMDSIAYIRQELQWANQLLEMVMTDVTPEQAHWTPPGLANPLGALYVHAVIAEDGVINRIVKGGEPMFASTWSGKTGASAMVWGMDFESARAIRLDLPVFRTYAQAVYAAAEEALNSLTEADLEREIDLSPPPQRLGKQSLAWVLTVLLISHLNNMIGEISCLKGIQGARGYPF